MKLTLPWIALCLGTLAMTSCQLHRPYRAPREGVTVQNQCGLTITATSVKVGRRGFDLVFDLANDSDQAMLVPFTGLEAAWGSQVANVTVDARRIRKLHTCTHLRREGDITAGLFADTFWVTGANGEPPAGEAIYLKARSRVQRLTLRCRVPPQQGEPLIVRWPAVYSGDAAGTIDATLATNVEWVMQPIEPEPGD